MSGVNVGFATVVLDSTADEPVGAAMVHAYVYGWDPPVTTELRLICVPTLPLDGAVIDADRGGVTESTDEPVLAATLELPA